MKKIITLIEDNSVILFRTVFLFLVAAGLGYSFYLGDQLRFPDEQAYYDLAQNLANGLGYSFDGIKPSAWRTPGYPIFLALFIKLGATVPLLRFVNFLALAAALLVIRSILTRENVAPEGVAVSALLILAYPVLFYTAGTLYPQTVFTLLMVSMFHLITREKLSWLGAVLFGFVSACIIMLHPTAIFLPPLMYLWRILPKNPREIYKGVISALVIIAVFSPWIIRNYQVFNAFVPLSLHGGDTLYWGNNPDTDIDAWYKSVTEDIGEKTEGMTEVEEDRFYKQLALRFWREQPVAALKLYLDKLVHYFNFQNKFYVQSEFSPLKAVVMFVTYYPLLLCLVIRLLCIPIVPLRRVEILLVAIYLVSAMFHAIFLTRIRFRLPYDVLLITHIGIMFSLLAARVKGSVQK